MNQRLHYMKHHISLLASPFKTFSCHSPSASRLLFQMLHVAAQCRAQTFSPSETSMSDLSCVTLRKAAQNMAAVSLKEHFMKRGSRNHTTLLCFLSLCVCESERASGFSRVCGLISQRILLRCLKWLFPCRLLQSSLSFFPFYFSPLFEVSSVSALTKRSFHVRHYA